MISRPLFSGTHSYTSPTMSHQELLVDCYKPTEVSGLFPQTAGGGEGKPGPVFLGSGLFHDLPPVQAFISGLLDKIRGMQKLSTPQKK